MADQDGDGFCSLDGRSAACFSCPGVGGRVDRRPAVGWRRDSRKIVINSIDMARARDLQTSGKVNANPIPPSAFSCRLRVVGLG